MFSVSSSIRFDNRFSRLTSFAFALTYKPIEKHQATLPREQHYNLILLAALRVCFELHLPLACKLLVIARNNSELIEDDSYGQAG